MSHRIGLFNSCPGRWVKKGRARDGIQQERCSRCGALRNRKVRPCFWHGPWKNVGKPQFGAQKQKCDKCGKTRTTQRGKCFWGCRRFSAKGGKLRCVRCGTPKR